MPDPLLMTKVSLPIMRHILVPRKKVLRQLSAGVRDGHLLTLVSAPAGYGKTTTVRMWAEEVGYPVAWLTLEKSDNDLKQFLTYFLTALGQAAGLGGPLPPAADALNRTLSAVEARLADVTAAARGTQNLLYPMKEALRAKIRQHVAW